MLSVAIRGSVHRHLGRVYTRLYTCLAVKAANRSSESSASSYGRLRYTMPFVPNSLTSQRKAGLFWQAAASCLKPRRSLGTSSFSDSTDDGRLVYIGNLARSVFGVKIFSYSTSLFTLCVMPYVLSKSGIGVDSIALQIAFCSIIGFFTFVTPCALHLMTKGYVIRLYHKLETDSYTAVTYNMFLAEKRTVFHQHDVKVPGVSKMFTTFYAGSKSMLVNPMLFSTPHEYNHLMGYDKPFSFDMEELKESKDN
ncbi:transmembrane protein 70, mitochondrial [Ambystoma mexicanum]|uniref:transmembrane protein 70, mitochondrial n=1 Tax=Ambystoma mexicanum TaxID=8296 RepID=UPI0037E74C35